MSLQKTDASNYSGEIASASLPLRARLGDYYELTKPRLSFLSVLTAVIGYLAVDPNRDFSILTSLLLGTSLCAGGAATLNQWLERDADARMVRTKDRPIAVGRVTPLYALLYGLVLSLAGCNLLYFGTNPLAGLLSAATVASYVLIYTPLKKLTTWNTLVGAIPGSLPPLIGCAAAQGQINSLGWILFLILFFWQMPHFFAIAWTYRKDYKKGGFVMLSNSESGGKKVAYQAFTFTLALVASTLIPPILGYSSWVYGTIAIFCGFYILRYAVAFLNVEQRDGAARKLFLASIFYLPALLFPLVLDLWLL